VVVEIWLKMVGITCGQKVGNGRNLEMKKNEWTFGRRNGGN
jgi:hypothetical protein